MFSLLFPGQGSQFVGMGSDLYNKYGVVKDTFHRVDQALGFKLSEIILNGPDEKLKLTQNTQPAIMTVGVSIFKLLKDEFNFNFSDAKFFAGHSLGEYTALVCANSISLETAAILLHERGKAMQDAVPVGQGAMLAVLGVSKEELLETMQLFIKDGVCEIANDNCPGQIVVSGDKKSIYNLQKILKDKSKKGIILPVSAPFHCSLMKKAATTMRAKIFESEFIKPSPPIITNVNATQETNVDKIKELLVQQITAKVRWRESVEYIINMGINDFIEIGPGKVLSGLVRRINNKTKITCLCNLGEIQKYTSNV